MCLKIRRLLSVKDVARMLAVNRFRVYEWVRLGKIPFLRLVGGIRFDPEEIENWLRRHRGEELTPQPPLLGREGE